MIKARSVIPAGHSVIPKSFTVIPAGHSVIPAQAGIQLCILFFILPSLSRAQDDTLQTALAANTYLKSEIQKLKSQQQELLKSFKAITQENITLKQDLRQVLRQRDEKAPAAISAAQFMRLRKEIEDAHYNLGVMLQGQGKFDEAIKEYERVLQINPEDADAHYNLALIFDSGKSDPKKAVEHYQRFLELEPQAPEAKPVKDSLTRLAGF